MIESVMYFAIGFFLAVVIGMGLFPLVHNRAVRLTGQRLEAAAPLSIAEVQAEKDQLRAEFAMSTRRLEMAVDQLKLRASNQLIELGKKTEAVNQLKMEMGEKAAAAFTMETREQTQRDRIALLESDLAARSNTLSDAERLLAERQSALESLSRELGERTQMTDSQRVEIVALKTRADSLMGKFEKLEADVRHGESRANEERNRAETALHDLDAERTRTQLLTARTTELEDQYAQLAKEGQDLGRKILELETRLSEQGRKLAEREYDVIRLKTELDGAQKTESELRTLMASMEDRHSGATARLAAEKSMIETELATTRAARNTLEQTVAQLRQEAEEAARGERGENAVLRERLDDIASEVARLTMAIEGSGSPIETMLATGLTQQEPHSSAGGMNGARTPAPTGSLAERIRTLQTGTPQPATPPG